MVFQDYPDDSIALEALDTRLYNSNVVEEFHCLSQAQAQLSDHYRKALVMYYQEGQSMKAISKTLNISVSGVKMRIHRGLEKLRSILAENVE